MEEEIILYSGEFCPVCKQIKKKLDISGIKYSIIDDVDCMPKGILSIPTLEVNGKRMLAQEAFNWISEKGNNDENR